jgi:hypothetical protein
MEPKPSGPSPAAILQFYASPGVIAKGDKALLCYGVEGAASVRLEPAIEDITPSRARCVEAKPEATAKYTLLAKNSAGAEISKEIEVVVDPKLQSEKAKAGQGGLILFFTPLAPKVAKGAQATLCYGVKGAVSVSLNPPVQVLKPSDKLCFQTRPEVTTTYTLTATSASGAKDTESLRIAVE